MSEKTTRIDEYESMNMYKFRKKNNVSKQSKIKKKQVSHGEKFCNKHKK